MDEEGELSHEVAKKIFKEEIRRVHEEWKQLDLPQGVDAAFVEHIKDEHKALIVKHKKKVFPSNLTSVSSRWLTEIVLWCLAKTPAHDLAPHTTGLVIAGFGEDEIFPSFISYAVGGVVCDRVQVREMNQRAVSPETRAVVAPFAQREMVQTFMEGVDPEYGEAIGESIADIVLALPKMIVDEIDEIPASEKPSRIKRFRNVSQRLLVRYRKALEEYRHKVHVGPIVRAIGILPKNELAAVAESLVNITAFKRRVSMDAETVGGPIDVAVISKGDGFIWINRKHYFDAELNHHFIQGYLSQGEEDERPAEDEDA